MTVHYEVEGPVAVVTIDRPEVRNAVDRPTADALADAFDALRRRRRARGRGAHRRAAARSAPAPTSRPCGAERRADQPRLARRRRADGPDPHAARPSR